jgi:hypothetical protein
METTLECTEAKRFRNKENEAEEYKGDKELPLL